MSYYRRQVRVNARDPRAVGQCDRCNRIVLHDALRKDMMYVGNALMWNGFLVCKRCDDVPFENDRPIFIPADPPPIVNPRPDRDQSS